MLEERDPDLNEEEDIIIEYSSEEPWRNISKDYNDKSNIHVLRLDV